MIPRIVGILRASAADVSYLTLGTVAAAAASLLSQLFAARLMGPESFGIFAAALTSINFVGPIAAFGVAGFWLKVFGREGRSATRWIRPSLKLCAATTLAATTSLVLWFQFQPDPHLREVGLVLLPLIAMQVSVSLAIANMQVRENYLYASFWYAASPAGRLAAVGLLAVLPMAFVPMNLAVINMLVGLVLAVLAIRTVASSYPKVSASGLSPASVARRSWQFGLDGVLYLAYHQLGLVVVLFAIDEAAAGMFAAAFIFLNAAYMFPSIIFQKFLLPKLHRWANSSPDSLILVARLGSVLMFLAGLLMASFIYFFAHDFVRLVFGEGYSSGVLVLQTLALAIPFKYAASSVGSVLTSGHLLRSKLLIMGTTAAVYLPTCYILSSFYGLAGAAVATILAEVMLLAGFASTVRLRLKEAISA